MIAFAKYSLIFAIVLSVIKCSAVIAGLEMVPSAINRYKNSLLINRNH